jgi:hypothetical protein
MLPKDEPLPKKTADLKGVKVAYTDMGKGKPILFVHGIPTSSYLWRNVIRPLRDDYRCIAGSKRMEIMPFAGHFWQEEIPELGAKYVKEFMENS